MLSSSHTIFIKATVLLENGTREVREGQKPRKQPRKQTAITTSINTEFSGTLSNALSLCFAGG